MVRRTELLSMSLTRISSIDNMLGVYNRTPSYFIGETNEVNYNGKNNDLYRGYSTVYTICYGRNSNVINF